MLFRYPTLTRVRLRPESHPLSLTANRTSRLQVTACPRSQPIRSSATAASLRELRKGVHLCARCDGKPEANDPLKMERRQTCATNPNMFETAPPSVARSATEDSASCGTIPGELRSVQRSALIGLRRVRKPTANGYHGFAPPDRAPSSTASHWEAQREIHPGQRQDAPPSTCLCDV